MPLPKPPTGPAATLGQATGRTRKSRPEREPATIAAGASAQSLPVARSASKAVASPRVQPATEPMADASLRDGSPPAAVKPAGSRAQEIGRAHV